jgi:hypothetical protein
VTRDPHPRPISPGRLSTVIASIATVCARSTAQRRSTEEKLADVLVPRDQEQRLGLQVKKELEQKQGSSTSPIPG